ncbi:MAG: cache domain-containing protein [Verrucomicrobiota bacterium]|nr:cache domain-containing protein [Verrucomicrobiota bacterium]
MKIHTVILLALACQLPGSLPAQTPAPSDTLERSITSDQVMALVKLTGEQLAHDSTATIAKINKGEAPFKDAANPTLYVFIYDPDVLMVAHPRADLVGKSVKGKPDVKGKKFRDEIVERALKEGTGWVDYLYQKPNESGIHPKTTYFSKVTGSDGHIYIVCSGKYQDNPTK